MPLSNFVTLLCALLLGGALSLPVHTQNESARATSSKSSSLDWLSDSLDAGQAAAQAASAAAEAAMAPLTSAAATPVAAPIAAPTSGGGGGSETGEATGPTPAHTAPTLAPVVMPPATSGNAAPSGNPLFDMIAEVAPGAPLLGPSSREAGQPRPLPLCLVLGPCSASHTAERVRPYATPHPHPAQRPRAASRCLPARRSPSSPTSSTSRPCVPASRTTTRTTTSAARPPSKRKRCPGRRGR